MCGLLNAQSVLLDHLPALGPLPRLLRQLSMANGNSGGSVDSTSGLLRMLHVICNSCVCVDALAKLECVAPVAAVMRHHPQLVVVSLEVLDKLMRNCGPSMEEVSQQCVSADLISQLLKLLEESSSNPHLTSAGRALAVSILKQLSTSRVHGQRISALLEQSTAWSSYKDQRHDLFLQAPTGSSMAPLSLPAGVAGYLTQQNNRGPTTTTRTGLLVPGCGSGGGRQLPPPNDPLQSLMD